MAAITPFPVTWSSASKQPRAIAAGVFGDGRLVSFAESLWTATTPIRFVGTWFPHVMTVVRLGNGTVLLHSPCEPSKTLVEGIARIGPVAHVVAPNWFHDLYLREYRRVFPKARFWGPRFLRRQQPSLVDDELDETIAAPFAAELPFVSLRGLLSFDESIFYYRAARTLIVADLFMNAVAGSNAPLTTRVGYRFFGLDGRVKVFPLLRWLGYSSRPSLRRAAAQMRDWNPQRLIVGHGSPVSEGVPQILQRALHFLD